MRLEAEGNKAQRMNLGIANQEATRKRSEGEKDAKIEMAYAESRSLEMIGESLKAEPERFLQDPCRNVSCRAWPSGPGCFQDRPTLRSRQNRI